MLGPLSFTRRRFLSSVAAAGATAFSGRLSFAGDPAAATDPIDAALWPNPASELAAVAADLRTLDPISAAGTRYLSLYNLPPADRPLAAAIVSFVLNSLSRSDTIQLPLPICEGRILRINLLAYAPRKADFEAFAAAWEKMVAGRANGTGGEPYWHLATEVLVPGTAAVAAVRGKNGAIIPAVAAVPGSKKIVFTDAGHVGLEAAAYVRTATGSAAALIRADWFLATATIPPAYHNFAGIPGTEEEWFNRFGVLIADVKRLRSDRGANMIRSGITQHLRRVVRRQGHFGGVWGTFDNSESIAAKDPIRNPFDFVFEAGEHIGAKANGLHLFALYDAGGKRQDAVPDTIAKDTSDFRSDGRVVPMLSCVRCHVEDGLRPFENDQKKLLAGAVDLYADTPEAAERLASFYGSNLGKQLLRDQEDYAEAVARATGPFGAGEDGGPLDAKGVAGGLMELVGRYSYELVTPAMAARELGLPVAGDDVAKLVIAEEGKVKELPPVQVALRAVLGSSKDPVILALCEGLAVQRQQWEASFPEAALLAVVKTKGEK